MFDEFGAGPSMEEMGLEKEPGIINPEQWSDDEHKKWLELSKMQSGDPNEWNKVKDDWMELNGKKDRLESKPLSPDDIARKIQLEKDLHLKQGNESGEFNPAMSAELYMLYQREKKSAKKRR